MRFFSKIVTFCNIAFIISAVLRIVDYTSAVKANPNTVQQTNFFVGTVLILSVFAIFLNIIFIIALVIFGLRKKETNISTFLSIINALMLPLQIIYFFFIKSK